MGLTRKPKEVLVAIPQHILLICKGRIKEGYGTTEWDNDFLDGLDGFADVQPLVIQSSELICIQWNP